MLHAVCVCLPRRLRRRHHYHPKWDFPHFMPEKKRRALHFPPTFVFPPLQPFLVPLKKEENCMFFHALRSCFCCGGGISLSLPQQRPRPEIKTLLRRKKFPQKWNMFFSWKNRPFLTRALFAYCSRTIVLCRFSSSV